MDLAAQPRNRRDDKAARPLAGGELAIAAERDAGARREVPEVAIRRGAEVAVGVALLVPALAQIEPSAVAVVRRPQLLDGVRRIGCGREGMPVRAHLGVDVEVVEEHELPREGVCVRRHLLAEESEIGIAVAGRDVAEHLVVGTVLADHVEEVLDRRALPGAVRDR